jgi:hypothetical protein
MMAAEHNADVMRRYLTEVAEAGNLEAVRSMGVLPPARP